MPDSSAIGTILVPLGIIIATFIVFVFILTSPEEPSKAKAAPFINRYYAHRGLYSKDQSIPENSMAAFAAARDAGYGIELDIQLTKDGKIVVAHDSSIKRITGYDGLIGEMDYEELCQYNLYDTDQKIPLFWDVLELIDGAVPLIIEFKPGDRSRELFFHALQMLDAYEGLYCVESFDPGIVRWFKAYKPSIFRGQLSMPADHYDKAVVPAIGRFFMSRCLFGLLNKPNFISYEVGPKPWTVKLAEKRGALKACWTSHDPSDAERNDMVIFEHYNPPTHFEK